MPNRLDRLIQEAANRGGKRASLDDILAGKANIILKQQPACVVEFHPWTGRLVVQTLVRIDEAVRAGVPPNRICRKIHGRKIIPEGFGFLKVLAGASELPERFIIRAGKQITVDIAKGPRDFRAVNFRNGVLRNGGRPQGGKQ